MVSYWSYWVHRVQELWNNYEDLNERVRELEARLAEIESAPRAVSPVSRSPQVAREDVPQGDGAPSAAVAVVMMALRHLGRAATVEELNDLLKKQGINESLKETLLGRLKEGVQKGFLAYDPESKRFGMAG